MVQIVNKRGVKAKVPERAARVLVKSGRFSYLTASLAEAALPTTATLEPVEPPKKRGRPKKVKDSETE